MHFVFEVDRAPFCLTENCGTVDKRTPYSFTIFGLVRSHQFHLSFFNSITDFAKLTSCNLPYFCFCTFFSFLCCCLCGMILIVCFNYCLKSGAFSVLKGPQIQHFIPHQDKCVYPSCLVCATTVEGIFIFETQAQSHMKGPMALRKNVAPERFHHLKLQNNKFDGSLTDPRRTEEWKLSEARFRSRITCCTVSRPDHGDRIYYFHAKFMCTNRIWWRKSFQTMPGK